MTSKKNWQCPYCAQDCSRHWNMVVHIRRTHEGLGNPMKKGDLNQAEKSLSSDSNRLNKNKEYPFYRNNSNLRSTNYGATDGDKECIGEAIDYVYRFLKEIEEKKYKLGEINRITNKHGSSAIPGGVPPSIPLHEYVSGMAPPYIRNLHSSPSPQTNSDAINFSNSKEATEKDTKAPYLSNYKHKEKEQHSDLHSYTSEEDTSLYAKWIIKRDAYGNIVSVFKHYEDPIHELLDDAKENAKYFTRSKLRPSPVSRSADSV
jgi:hypothetical protein